MGISVPKEVQEHVLEWRKTYEEELPVRWIDPSNLHVTVVPPWDVEDPLKPAKRFEKLSPEVDPFPLEFHTVTFGPKPSRPRLIWGEGDATEQFASLSTIVAQKLKRPRPKKEIRLHITVARFNPDNFVHFPVQYLADAVSWNWSVSSLVLFESHLEKTGAWYETISEVQIT